MGRPERHDADYFPFYVKDGKTLFILESKYGLQGIGFFTNLMRFLTRQPDHHICIRDESDRLYFFAQLRCPEESGMDMIGLMVKTGKLDAQLWAESRVIASQDLLDSLRDAYKNRNNPIIEIAKIRVSYPKNELTYQGNPLSSPGNPQRKGKERKGKDIEEPKGSLSPDIKPSGDGNGKYPPCPQQEIVALYHDKLPSLPRVKTWSEHLQVILRTRWKEDPQRQDLKWWALFFEYVQKSDFLMGRTETSFAADLEWLIRPKNFAKIANGRYHKSQGAQHRAQPGIEAWLKKKEEENAAQGSG